MLGKKDHLTVGVQDHLCDIGRSCLKKAVAQSLRELGLHRFRAGFDPSTTYGQIWFDTYVNLNTPEVEARKPEVHGSP